MSWIIFLLGYLFIGGVLGFLTYYNYEDKRYWDWGELLFALFCWGPSLALLCYIKIEETLEKQKVTLNDTLWKYLGWLKKVPEPFKSIIFLIIYISCIPIWVVYSFYLYFKKKWGKNNDVS